MMRGIVWKAITLAAFTVGMTSLSVAQSSAPNPVASDLTAKVGPPAAKQELKPTVEQEIDALKNRIDQLETEVKEAKAAALADSTDRSEEHTTELQSLRH